MSGKIAYTLFSDGGGEKSSNAAAAAILQTPAARYRVIAYLGGATNNEAEISGGLTGFSMIRALSGSEPASARWVCDSEYVLKSATGYINTWRKNGWKTASKQPVKNRALWEAYLQLSKGVSITPEHVRGHTGHIENEACDRASTWARAYGEEYLEAHGPGPVADAVGSDGEDDWFLIDARPFLESMRSCELCPETVDSEVLVAAVEQLNLASAAHSFAGAASKKPAEPRSGAEIKRILASLEDAGRSAKKMSDSNDAWQAIERKIELLTAEIKKMR